ncbi:hypothetical protein Ndes2526B_g08123 [Nannochloris sp. 'desiccata']|nr:hypothetical protein KSW81_002756 [Chlorella desiccata (nom. nud.)]
MCQARTSKGEKINTQKIAAIVATQNPENPTVAYQPKPRLNPAAIEFISSRSESEASSIGDEAETEQIDCEEVSTATEENRHDKDAKTQRMDQYYEETEEQHMFHGYQNYGWESPQGVLPPEGASPPPGQGVAYTTVPAHPAGMMPPPHYPSNPHPHQYGPSHYPVYHVYSHHPDTIERSASPPAIYPAGGSPPLAPGFISVPLQAQHLGHLRGSSPIPGGSPPPSSRGMHPAGAPMPVHHHHHPVSMGSSPPNNADRSGGPQHYHVYAAPHHPYAPHHGNEEYAPHPHHHLPAAHPNNNNHHPYHHHQYDSSSMMMAELQPRMSSMSLGGSPIEGSSPTSSSGIGIRNNTRASARIARSHRAGGAYNPSDFEFKISPPASGEDNGTSDGTAATADVKTTVMIRNIPNKYTQDIMLTLLEEAKLNGAFDFFYLPIDFRNRCGLGYAFLNFLSHADAVKGYNYFHNRRWDEFNSKKVCEVTYARVQGKDNLVQHFKNAKFPSNDAEYCPLVYRHSQNASGGKDSARVRAHMPLPIHEYLASLEEEEKEEVTTTHVEAEEEKA